MALLKPSQCQTCPLFDNDMARTMSSAEPAVLFLFGSPYEWRGIKSSLTFRDRASDIINRIIIDLYKEEEAHGPRQIGIARPMALLRYNQCFMYAVQCLGGEKGNNKIVDTCSVNFTQHAISSRKPKVIIALGSVALRSLKISGGIKNLRGSVLQTRIADESYIVVPTISPLNLLGDDAGLYKMLKNDIARAATIACAGTYVDPDLSVYTAGYHYPNTIEELAVVTNEFRSYSHNNQPVSNSLMSLDTETNTLTPWAPNARVIMLSAAVAPGKALAMFLDHRAAPYDWRDALPYALRLTMSEHPKAWWNFKFDFQMFRYSLLEKLRALCISADYLALVERIVGHSLPEILAADGVNNTRWDGLLGEHMLDEDKKGYYSLKTVVSDYVPEFSGYESKLKEEFRKALEAKLEETVAAFRDPAYIPVFGMDENVIFPFTPSNYALRYSQLLAEAELQLEKLTNLRKGQTKANYPGKSSDDLQARKKRLRGQELRLEEWVKRERAEAKAYERFLRAYVEESQEESDDSTDKESVVTYEDLDPNVLQQYAAIDADVTYQICRKQRIAAHQEDPAATATAANRHRLITLMDRHYLPLTTVLANMQAEGVWVDKKYLRSMYGSIDIETRRLEGEIRAELAADLGIDTSPDKLKLNNPKTLANIFVAYYGLPVVSRTEKGYVSVDEDALKAYGEAGNALAPKVLTWRKLGKAKSTYVAKFLELSAGDGRIHGNIHINGTSTGRGSSSEPNLQNTPLMLGDINIKQSFVPTPIHEDWWWGVPGNPEFAEAQGWLRGDLLVWGDLDFSGAEVRVLTRYAPDHSLIAALVAGQDTHSWMTAEIHGYTYDEVNKGRKIKGSEFDVLRGDTKKVVFGTLYGITAHGLNARMGFTEERAQEIIDKLLNRFPDIKIYIDNTKREISTQGFVSTPYGRFRRFPMVRVGRWMEGRNHRQGVNFKIQSYCSDIVMSCLGNIAKTRLDVALRLLLTVHDSVCFEMPYRLLHKLPGYLKASVEGHIQKTFPDMPVAMPYDINVGPSYGVTVDLKKFLNWMAESAQLVL